MIQTWNLNNVPTFNRTNKTIKYKNGDVLTFPARKGSPFAPAKLVKK